MTLRRDKLAGAGRGAVLFEVVLAVALFAGAAAFTLGAVRSVFAALDRLKLQQEAVDLASSKIAELEAGLITLADLRGDAPAQPGVNHEWSFDLHTQRTEFTGLTLVELTVRQRLDERDTANPMSFTLRQLVALRRSGGANSTADQASDADE